MHRHRLALAGALYVFVLAAVPVNAQECADRFWAPRSLMMYDDPREAVIGDFDGDGRVDLAVTVYTGAGGLRVLVQRPDGTYAESVYNGTHGVGPRTSGLATADLDGDGDLDLVVVNDNHTFSIFANDGAGAFTHRQTLAGWGDLALGDLDGDGDPEVVLAGGATHDVAVYTNAGGTFAFTAGYAVAGTPGWVVLAHLDSDAHLDVAVAANADASVSVLWNAGTGALLPAVRLQGHLSTWNLVAGDVNGDGRSDLLTGQFQGTQVGVLANLGERAFAPLVGFTTATRTTVLALGDTDDDGDLDLAVTGGVSVAPPAETVSLWRNAGNGTFTLADRVSGGDEPGNAAFGDLDGDGDADLVVVASASNSVRLYANAGGHLAAAPDAALGGNSIGDASGATAITHSDLDGDGRDDLIVTQRTQLRVFTRAGAPPAVYAAGTFSTDVAAGDMDGDGDRDVVLVDRTNDQIATRRNDGTGRLTLPEVRSTCHEPRAVSLADMDGDGDLDAVVACASDRSVVVMTNNGTGVLASGGGELRLRRPGVGALGRGQRGPRRRR